jgi:probable F420-dependent oxidoreductase
MRLGVSLAQVGRLADPASVRSAAVSAEQVGYSSIWVLDRLLAPPAQRDVVGGDLPIPCPPALDPLSVLSYAAAVTTRVRLGTGVLVAPWYRPVVLARSLTSLDVLSDGRLTVGLGAGGSHHAGSRDAGEAGGVSQRALDGALDVLAAVWSGDPVSHDSRYQRIVSSWTGPEPVQKPHPPILLDGYTAGGLDRVARRADGWNPANLPIDVLAPLWSDVRDRAASHGRDPDAIQLVVRADIMLTDRPVESDRAPYAGTIEQIVLDIDATRRAGAHEVVLGLRGDHGLYEALEHYAAVAEALDATMTFASVH